MPEIKKMPKNAEFKCILCDFICFKLSNWNNHLQTQKHLYRHNGNQNGNAEMPKMLICGCGKKYMSNSGLWKHQKMCTVQPINSEIKDINDKQLIMMLVKQNALMLEQQTNTQNIMMEVIKNGTHNITNTNSHNKTFNLNVFLNETCKDAMNITDFVESIQLQLSDLENVGKLGYVNGISNIIVKNLNLLDETKRPIHCTDSKREVLYVKDEDKWEKDNNEKKKIRKVIKKVANKNSKLLPVFREKYPDCNQSISKYSDHYNKLIIEVMGGLGDNDLEKEDKIIRNIAKEVTIDKSNYI